LRQVKLRHCAGATLARLIIRDDIMTVLAWSEALAFGHQEMDATHQEFVALLNAVGDEIGRAHV
jgi:hypothetical protein